MNRRTALAGALASCAAAIPAGLLAAPMPAVTATVYLSPTCGCCKAWVSHLRSAGYATEILEVADIDRSKTALGVPMRLRSCHTAMISGYFIEGHVSADDIDRLLREKPVALGLAVPGMPVGSPGMEAPGVTPERYDTLLVLKNGATKIWPAS